jgi:DNA-binding transcriptional LysR family regulator
MQHHPQVTATCQVTSRRQAVEDLGDGLIHLALASPREFFGPVEFRRFISDPIRLITPLSHPWAIRGEIEPEELLETDFILRESGSGTIDVAAEGLAAVGIPIDQLNRVLILGNSEAIALAVEEGLGVGFVSQIVVTRLVNDRVATVKVKGVNMAQEVCIGRNTALPGTTAQNAFWEFVTDGLNPALAQLSANGLDKVLIPA